MLKPNGSILCFVKIGRNRERTRSLGCIDLSQTIFLVSYMDFINCICGPISMPIRIEEIQCKLYIAIAFRENEANINAKGVT